MQKETQSWKINSYSSHFDCLNVKSQQLNQNDPWSICFVPPARYQTYTLIWQRMIWIYSPVVRKTNHKDFQSIKKTKREPLAFFFSGQKSRPHMEVWLLRLMSRSSSRAYTECQVSHFSSMLFKHSIRPHCRNTHRKVIRHAQRQRCQGLGNVQQTPLHVFCWLSGAAAGVLPLLCLQTLKNIEDVKKSCVRGSNSSRPISTTTDGKKRSEHNHIKGSARTQQWQLSNQITGSSKTAEASKSRI